MQAQAEPNAAYAPPHDKKVSNGVISGAVTVRHTAAEATTLSAAEQRDGAISSDNSKKSSKSLVKRSPAPPTTGSSKAETSESEEQQSPITNNGLPPFRGGGLELNGSVSSLNDPNMEYGDPHTQEMVAQWDRNTFVLRRALNINYEDIYEPGAWEELARYKGLKCSWFLYVTKSHSDLLLLSTYATSGSESRREKCEGTGLAAGSS